MVRAINVHLDSQPPSPQRLVLDLSAMSPVRGCCRRGMRCTNDLRRATERRGSTEALASRVAARLIDRNLHGQALRRAAPPKIVRFHGRGEVVTPSSPAWEELRGQFPQYPGARTVICADITRVSDSCGYGVPKFEHVEDRDAIQRWAETKGAEGLPIYRRQKNARSIDGLPAMEPGESGV